LSVSALVLNRTGDRVIREEGRWVWLSGSATDKGRQGSGILWPTATLRAVTVEAVSAGTDPASTGGPAPWLSPEEDAVWRRLLAVHGRLIARLDDELRTGYGLSLADYDVLVSLSEAQGGALRMRDLAERVMLSPSGLTRRVDRLVARGLVARRTCPSDGRGSLATLTGGGRELLEAAAPTHVDGVRRYLLEPLGSAALPGLGRALLTIGAATEPAGTEPAGTEPAGTKPAGTDPATGRATTRDQPGSEPVPTGRPAASQPLVPPATDTAG
jgi:DNA-binding MarR family transcriptional regulator